MTIEEMQAQLEKMKDDIEHMKVRVSEYEHMISVIKAQDNESKFERVSKGERYFTIGFEDGNVVVYVERDVCCEIDDNYFNHNNYFKTSERAHEVADKFNFLLKLERLHDTFCPDFVPDWDDFNSYKWTIYRDHNDKKYKVIPCYSAEHRTLAYFPSEEIAQKVCDILNSGD